MKQFRFRVGFSKEPKLRSFLFAICAYKPVIDEFFWTYIGSDKCLTCENYAGIDGDFIFCNEPREEKE